MKDIKSLYFDAKNRGRQSDIDSYVECIQDYLENKPCEYLSNIKYIISSNIGLKTLNEFVEQHGIPLVSYNTIMESLEDGIKKCRIREIDDTDYREAMNMMESFKKKYNNCFIMFEEFENNLGNKYIEAYYKNLPILRKATKGKLNLSGILSAFGEACIPDMIIYSSQFGNPAVVLESLKKRNNDIKTNHTVLTQWLCECFKDISNIDDYIIESITHTSLEGIVNSINERNMGVYRESVLMKKDDICVNYTENEIDIIKDLISFKENQITHLEDSTKILKLQSEIYSLYETFGNVLEEDVADSVIPMFPGSNQKVSFKEDWLGDTHNKKTGEIPDYIKKNHDINYGEDDPENKKSPEENEPVLDDYKRPSAEDKKDDTKIVPYDYSQDKDDSSSADDETSKDDDKDHKKAVTNYYYYTYTNSHNTNSNSYNKHNTDDHSSNKRVNSDNISRVSESNEPWELNIFGNRQVYTEGFLDRIFGNDKDKFNVKTTTYFPMSNDEFKEVIKSIKEIEKKMKKIVDEYSKKYPIYGLSANLDEDINDYVFGVYIDDETKAKGTHKRIDGLCVEKIDSKYVFQIEMPHLCGMDIYDFMDNLEKKYPEEFKKYVNKHGAGPRDFAVAWWTEKFLEYDSNLDTICSQIGKDILKEIPEAFNWDPYADWDDGPLFDFKVPAKTLYPKFDDNNVVEAKITFVSGFAKHVSKKNKKLFFKEAVGDADDKKPESDNPIQDTMLDIDRALTKTQQAAKKKVQGVINTGRTIVKPFKRTAQWLSNIVTQWKDANETEIKERLADPRSRNNLFSAIKSAIKYGSLYKAGLLLNPIILYLTITKKFTSRGKEFRLRNEMIGELNAELEIIDEKIKDAGSAGDNKAKYQLMRFKNELNKKLIRVGGTKEMADSL